MYTLYIIRCSDDSLYTGIAKDLDKRLEVHKTGKGSVYVRSRLPFSLVYTEKHTDRSQATRREIEIKKMSRAEKEKLIDQTD